MKKSLRKQIKNNLKSTWLNKRSLQEQNPEDDDTLVYDGGLLDTITLYGDGYDWEDYDPDVFDTDGDGIPDNFDPDIDDDIYEIDPELLDLLDNLDPDDDEAYYTNSCTAYGCMDPEAYNYNPTAGPWVFCNTYCHYDGAISQQDQNYAEEAFNCVQMGDDVGGSWIPCYVNNGYSYNTVGGIGGTGGVQMNGYIVECCQAGYQTCSTSFGCTGSVFTPVLDIDGDDNDWPDGFDPDDIACNAETIGCRNPIYANFHPDHTCDCDANYIGPWTEGAFAGNQDCCSNDILNYCPECIWDGFDIEVDFGDLCFTPDSLVTMEDGTVKPIKEIEVGDIVKSEMESSKVLQIDIHKGTFDVYSFNGEEAFVTEEHPFKTTEGWKAINPIETFKLHQVNSNILSEGDIVLIDGGEKVISSIEKGEPVNEVYNLRLDNEHVYYVNGYLVHNGKGDDQGPIVDPVGPPGEDIDELIPTKDSMIGRVTPNEKPMDQPDEKPKADPVKTKTQVTEPEEPSTSQKQITSASKCEPKCNDVMDCEDGEACMDDGCCRMVVGDITTQDEPNEEKDKFGKLKEEIKRFNQLIK